MSHPKVIHPKAVIKKFDSRMVDVMARVLGSVIFVWFCLILDAIGFVALVQQTLQALGSHQSLLILINLWVVFIAQSFIQLVALPVLQNYQNRQSAADEAKANVDHQALTYLATLQDEQLEILKRLDGSH